MQSGWRFPRKALASLSALVAVGLAACGTQEIDPKKVEQLIRSDLEQKGFARSIKSVNCPSGQPSKTGHTFECTLAGVDNSTAKVPAKVTNGEDGTVAVGRQATARDPNRSGDAGASQAASEYDAAYAKLGKAHRRFSSQVRKDAKAGNVAAIDADMSELRDDYYRFDGEIRRIQMPSAVRNEYYRVLESNRSVIADLDAYAAAGSRSEKQRMSQRVANEIDHKPYDRLQAALKSLQ